MSKFIVKDRKGREIQRGDVITDFRFQSPTERGVDLAPFFPFLFAETPTNPSLNRERMSEVFGLTVTEEEG